MHSFAGIDYSSVLRSASFFAALFFTSSSWALIGGNEVQISSAVYYYIPTEAGDFPCSGVLIRPNAILTAAHCIHSSSDRDLRFQKSIRLQSFDRVVNPASELLAETYQNLEILSLSVHPTWEAALELTPDDPDRVADNPIVLDLAVITLRKNLPFAPANVPRGEYWDSWPTSVLSSGSGATSWSINSIDGLVLKASSVKSVSLDSLHAQIDVKDLATNQMTETAPGDSGGGIYLENSEDFPLRTPTVIGINSVKKEKKDRTHLDIGIPTRVTRLDSMAARAFIESSVGTSVVGIYTDQTLDIFSTTLYTIISKGRSSLNNPALVARAKQDLVTDRQLACLPPSSDALDQVLSYISAPDSKGKPFSVLRDSFLENHRLCPIF